MAASVHFYDLIVVDTDIQESILSGVVYQTSVSNIGSVGISRRTIVAGTQTQCKPNRN